jgi:cytochrome c oxidase cbb3-type subunit I/II
MFVWFITLLKRFELIYSIEDELAEAPELQKISSRSKGEKFHPWLERKPIQLQFWQLSLF